MLLFISVIFNVVFIIFIILGIFYHFYSFSSFLEEIETKDLMIEELKKGEKNECI